MRSRDRMLAAITHQPVDHVPLFINTFQFTPPAHLAWSSPHEKSLRMLSLGLDEIVSLDLAEAVYLPPEVRVSTRLETRADEPCPVLTRVYETPDGTLRHVVRQTADYPFKEIPLLNDYNVPAPRVIEYPVNSAADLPALRWLLHPPDASTMLTIHEEARAHRRFCDEHGIVFAGWGPRGTDALIWLCGVENAVMLAMDQPDVAEELHEIIFETDAALLTLLADCGVDLIIRRGWYDSTAIWSPTLFRRFAKPRLMRLTAMAHDTGIPFALTMSSGMMPVLDDLAEIGYDLHYHVDPVQGNADLPAVKRAFAGTTASLGGVNAPITLHSGTNREIEDAVETAVNTLGPTGFILSPVDCLFQDTRWSRVEVLIEAWKHTWTGHSNG